MLCVFAETENTCCLPPIPLHIQSVALPLCSHKLSTDKRAGKLTHKIKSHLADLPLHGLVLQVNVYAWYALSYFSYFSLAVASLVAVKQLKLINDRVAVDKSQLTLINQD